METEKNTNTTEIASDVESIYTTETDSEVEEGEEEVVFERRGGSIDNDLDDEREQYQRHGPSSSNLEALLRNTDIGPAPENVYCKIKGYESEVDLIIPIDQSLDRYTLESFRQLLELRLRNASMFSFTDKAGQRVLTKRESEIVLSQICKTVSVRHHTFGTTVQQMHVSLVPSRGHRKRRREAVSMQYARCLLKRLRMFSPSQLRSLNMKGVVEKLTFLTKSQ